MPNCFTLTVHGESQPSKLSDIDNCMCAHFGVQPDPEYYYQSWVDVEGFALACGRDWEWMRANYPGRHDIINWLEANYTPDAWAERR